MTSAEYTVEYSAAIGRMMNTFVVRQYTTFDGKQALYMHRASKLDLPANFMAEWRKVCDEENGQ